MYNENTVSIIGNIGKIEIKTTDDNKEFATLSVATNERWIDKSNIKHERTDWHRCVTFQPERVKLIKNHVTKGSYIKIGGKLRTRSYEKDGETRYTVEIEISQIGFLSPKAGGDDEATEENGEV